MTPQEVQIMLDIFQGIGIAVVGIFIVVGLFTILDKILE
jgi:hypothetical protein